MKKIYLFDVDNVLIEPLAYEVAMQKTIKYFANRLGIKDFSPTPKEKRDFEARGVHDIWDITDIAIAVQIDNLIQSYGKKLSGSPAEKLKQLKNSPSKRPNYEEIIQKVPLNSKHPPADIEKLLSDDSLIKEFIQNTRDTYKNWGTRIFQEIILGEKIFEQVYELKSESKEKKSLMELVDYPLINKSSLKKLEGQTIAIYTGRPGLPPIKPYVGYPSDAEIALKIIGLNSKFPLVSMGCMEWLAKQTGETTERLTKPDSTQALAAIRAAITGEIENSLEKAYELTRKNKVDEVYKKLSDSQIYVFEDAPSGVRAVYDAVALLNKYGINAKARGVGIYAKNKSKKENLGKICEKIFPDINKAIDYVLD